MAVHTRIGPVAVAESGSGPPLVLLHANPGDSRDYAKIVPELASHHRVIAVDWPGYGNSPPPNPPTAASAPVFADVLEDLVAALELEPAILIGNSVGGFAAARLAIKAPERVRALVLVDSGGFTSHSPFSRAFCRLMGSETVSRRVMGQFARRYLRRRTMVVQDIIARATAGRRDPATVSINAAVWRSFLDPDHDLRRRASAIVAPTLLIWGRRDPILRWRKDGTTAQRAIPNAHLVVLDTGHMPFAEDPQSFLAVLRPFLATLNEDENTTSTA